ncbi:MAG: hypothetical protein SGI92_31375 [Bryobacteraceae bacterium]|nr:hypothetical protein [Bryobacteraceae bacterium]
MKCYPPGDRKRHILAVIALSLGLATQAHAGVVWTLQSGPLVSVSLAGYFTYDATTDTYSDWSISTPTDVAYGLEGGLLSSFDGCRWCRGVIDRPGFS